MQYRLFCLALLPAASLFACGEQSAPADPSSSSGAPASTTSSSSGGSSSSSGTNGDASVPEPTDPADILVSSPREGIAAASNRVQVEGQTEPGTTLTCSRNGAAGEPVEVDAEGKFSFVQRLVPGDNRLELRAQRADREDSVLVRNVYYGHRISGGNSQAVMLHEGAVYTWGRNELGQLGNGSFAQTWASTEAEDLALPSMYRLELPNVVSVVTRQTTMAALSKDGTLYTWGSNDEGQLGHDQGLAACGSSNTPCANAPALVPGVTDGIAVEAGYDHVLVLRDDGSVLSAGSNSFGQLGRGDGPGFAPVAGLSDIVQLAASSVGSYALGADGLVWAWGGNEYGNLGDGSSDDDVHATPTLVPDLEGVTALAAGNDTVYALLRDGSVRSWGRNSAGQAGNGAAGDDVLRPTPVLTADGGPLGDIESVAADGLVSFAVTRSGRVFAWGLGGLGQLGQGEDENGERDLIDRHSATPLKIADADLPNLIVRELEVGAGGPAFVWTTQNQLYGWGWSFRGSLGKKGLINAWAYSSPLLVFPLL